MQAKANIFAAILAAVTKNVKIVMLGNPLPLAENPVRLAEELSMIDMISKGRLVSGFDRTTASTREDRHDGEGLAKLVLANRAPPIASSRSARGRRPTPHPTSQAMKRWMAVDSMV